MSSTLIAFIAIRLCYRGLALLFTTLLLPMTVSQFASVSQDALIISLSLLVIALASRVVAQGRPAKTWEFALFVAVVVVTTLARPSQFALAPLGALVGRAAVIEMTAEPTRRLNNTLRGLDTLPLRVVPA